MRDSLPDDTPGFVIYWPNAEFVVLEVEGERYMGVFLSASDAKRWAEEHKISVGYIVRSKPLYVIREHEKIAILSRDGDGWGVRRMR